MLNEYQRLQNGGITSCTYLERVPNEFKRMPTNAIRSEIRYSVNADLRKVKTNTHGGKSGFVRTWLHCLVEKSPLSIFYVETIVIANVTVEYLKL